MVVYAIFNGGVNDLVTKINNTLKNVSLSTSIGTVTIDGGGTAGGT